MIKKYLALSIAGLILAMTGCDSSNKEQATSSEPVQLEAAKIDDASLQAHIDTSRIAMKALGSSLKAELKTAMEQGGPVQALDVCHTKAPELAAMVSADQGDGTMVGRTSLKHRNPNNAPLEWQATVLKDFETRKQAGEDPNSIEFSEVASVDGNKEFRYMKAIPTGEVCLKCHGGEIDPMVKDRINSLYPEDQATGFRLGDIRGAFVVTKPL